MPYVNDFTNVFLDNLENAYDFRFDKSHIVFSYQKMENGSLVLKSANQVYLDLLKISKNCISEDIFKTLEYQMAESIYASFSKYEKATIPITYAKKFHNNEAPWMLTVQLKDNVLYGIGEKLEDYLKVKAKIKPDFYSCNDTSLSNYISAVLKKTSNNHYIIESHSDNLFEYIKTNNIVGQKIQNILKTTHNGFTSILDSCLKSNQKLKFCQSVNISGKENFFYIELLPIVHNTCFKVLVLAKTITKVEYDMIYSEPYDYSKFFETDLFGVMVLNCQNKNNLFIERSNNYILKMITEVEDFFGFLNTDSIVYNCIESGKSNSHSIYVTTASGEKKHYTVTAVPVLYNSKPEKIFFTIVDSNDANRKAEKLLNLLSSREMEILKLVLDGYTNKYIAAKLKISEGTVKKTIYNGYKKLGISCRLELAKVFMSSN